MVRTLNLGILAHVDAGKTSLTERLLYTAGVLDEIGSVDEGSTLTDSLALERQRGITIKTAVASFAIDGVTINLIDTPGHPDFIAEVERVLHVLDGVVLVVSAVEGVQSQTRVLMRTLKRLRIPTLLFVNKIDRRGAEPGRVVAEIGAKLSPAVIAMGEVAGAGTRGADFVPFPTGEPGFIERLVEVLAERNDGVLEAFAVEGAPLAEGRLLDELRTQTGEACVHPVYFGSAITGAGVWALLGGITSLLPALEGDTEGAATGSVFKIERGQAGEKVAYVRMFSGRVRAREVLQFGEEREEKVTAIRVFEEGREVQRPAVEAGQIGKLWGLAAVRIGDGIGEQRRAETGQFAPPTLETIVVACEESERGALHVALTQLAEQDPLINVRQDDVRQEISVSLYGEVQKEVIGETLLTGYGIGVEFRETTTICIERPVGTGAAAEVIKVRDNPFLATVGLRIGPGAPGSGVRFEVATEVLGTMPAAFFRAVEDTVYDTLEQGLHGWRVEDCLVTMTHTGYFPRQSHAHQRFNKAMSSTGWDFRGLTPLVLMSALRQAGTVVHEPMHRFWLEVPAGAFGALAPVLARLGAVPDTQETRGPVYLLEGEIPAARVHELKLQLPAIGHGESVLESAFERYEPVRGTPPERPRTDHNPLDRQEYLLHVLRRV